MLSKTASSVYMHVKTREPLNDFYGINVKKSLCKNIDQLYLFLNRTKYRTLHKKA